MIWLHFSEKVNFTPRLSGLALFQKRYFLDRHNTYQDLFWASGGYQLKNIQFGGGMMFITTHKLLTSVYKSIPEHRPFQYLSYTSAIPETRWRFQIRAMVEERFLSKVMENEIATAEAFQLRYRLRSNLMFDFARNAQFKLSNEWLCTHELDLTQNRAFAEVAYAFKTLQVSTGYMNWYIKGINKPWRHIWLLRVDHKIRWQELAQNLRVFDQIHPQSMID
ncbi:MAG: DUF2490 domain-containing protein [Cytophagales bacterium]|nr:DUF2490 domain-containing protein [Cytophagales bacterium]